MSCAREYCEGNRKELLKAWNRSEKIGNARERSRGLVTKGDKEIVVECENNEISAYRRMTDLSPSLSEPNFHRDYKSTSAQVSRASPGRSIPSSRGLRSRSIYFAGYIVFPIISANLAVYHR